VKEADRTFVREQEKIGLVHDSYNCLACNAWYWDGEEDRPPSVHLWRKSEDLR